jgi:hypothetical protein
MEKTMTLKTLSAIAVASVVLAGPAFAQDTGTDGAVYQKPSHATRHFHGAYNQAPVNEPFIASPRAGWAVENYTYDRSRPGGLDADLNPSAN